MENENNNLNQENNQEQYVEQDLNPAEAPNSSSSDDQNTAEEENVVTPDDFPAEYPPVNQKKVSALTVVGITVLVLVGIPLVLFGACILLLSGGNF